MAEFMNPYTGSQAFTDDAKKKLLEAVATSGTAGEKAFKEAQAGVDSSQQAAIAAARERAATAGVDPGAMVSGANVQGRYDMIQNQLASSAADFKAHNASMGASGSAYMDKVNAALGALRGQNEKKAIDYEGQIKSFIAIQEQKAKEAAAAAAAQEAAELARLQYKEGREDARTMAKLQADSQKEASKAKGNITLNDLLGDARTVMPQAGPGASGVTNDMVMTAQDLYAFKKNQGVNTTPEIELARIIGEAYGLAPNEVERLFTPTALKSYVGDTVPKDPETITSLARKYDTKGVTPELARSVVNNVDFNRDVQNILAGAGGRSREEVDALLRQYYTVDRNWPSEYWILQGEYLPLLPTAKQLKER